MSAETIAQKNTSGFEFNGLVNDSELEKYANLQLISLLTLAPPSSTALGSIEKSGESYFSSVTVNSPFRSFFVQALGTRPRTAIKNVLEKLENELYRWRFGNGSGSPEQHIRISGGSNSPWVRSG